MSIFHVTSLAIKENTNCKTMFERTLTSYRKKISDVQTKITFDTTNQNHQKIFQSTKKGNDIFYLKKDIKRLHKRNTRQKTNLNDKNRKKQKNLQAAVYGRLVISFLTVFN